EHCARGIAQMQLKGLSRFVQRVINYRDRNLDLGCAWFKYQSSADWHIIVSARSGAVERVEIYRHGDGGGATEIDRGRRLATPIPASACPADRPLGLRTVGSNPICAGTADTGDSAQARVWQAYR